LDVGGHYGEYGSLIREAGYTGRIVTFEPASANLPLLSERSRADRDWRIMPFALGSTNGTATLHVAAATQLSSMRDANEYGRRQFGDKFETEAVEEVEVRTLDSVFDECIDGIASPRVYLKMDTQGLDLEVLDGASERIAEIAALQSELAVRPIYSGMPDYLEFIAYLNQRDFELSGIFPVTTDRDLRAIELDCIMVRRPELLQL
jgi:FkbM family methyltransferase